MVPDIQVQRPIGLSLWIIIIIIICAIIIGIFLLCLIMLLLWKVLFLFFYIQFASNLHSYHFLFSFNQPSFVELLLVRPDPL